MDKPSLFLYTEFDESNLDNPQNAFQRETHFDGYMALESRRCESCTLPSVIDNGQWAGVYRTETKIIKKKVLKQGV